MALLATVLWGASNFFYGLLENTNFGVTCLSWTGFFGITLIYKVYDIYHLPIINKSIMFENLFGEIRKKENIVHIILRCLNFFGLIQITILISDFSYKG